MNVIGYSGLHRSVPFKMRQMPGLTLREYRIAQGFDAAAALVTDSGLVAAAAEERFTRNKATGAFPKNALLYCLRAGGLAPSEIDIVAHGFSYEPVRELLLDQDEFRRSQFFEVYSEEAQREILMEHLPDFDWAKKLVQVPHHLAHAASAFYPSGFDAALLLVADGMGEVHGTTVAVGEGDKIRILAQIPAPHSLGILYGVLTHYLGFSLGLDEYKIMGLAPYGNAHVYADRMLDLIHLKGDGTFAIPVLCADRTIEQKETYSEILREVSALFGPPRRPEGEILQRHMDVAAALQSALQVCLLHVLTHFRRESGQQNLCMAGGVALNCTANGLIRRSRLFKRIFVQPAAGDDGTSLGAALLVQRAHKPDAVRQRMGMPFCGPEFDATAIREVLDAHPELRYVHFESFEALAAAAARCIARRDVIAWFQGRMEYGPRALGNRSILADPRDPGMRDRINALVKKREGFRPFAPAVTAESAPEIFDLSDGEQDLFAHMLFVTQVRTKYRATLPAVTHVDGSARVQVVSRDQNPRFWKLIQEFGRITGLPVVLNTSFNVRGEPIVCTPSDAVASFQNAGLDALVVGDFLVAGRDGGPGQEGSIET